MTQLWHEAYQDCMVIKQVKNCCATAEAISFLVIIVWSITRDECRRLVLENRKGILCHRSLSSNKGSFNQSGLRVILFLFPLIHIKLIKMGPTIMKSNVIKFFKIHLCLPIEPVHEISNNVVCATSKASDQPAHKRSLIRAVACRLSILFLLSYWRNTIWSF